MHFLLIECVLNLMLEFGGVSRFGCTLNCELELQRRVEGRYIDSGGVTLRAKVAVGLLTSRSGMKEQRSVTIESVVTECR